MSTEDFKAIVSSGMCKGINQGYLARDHHSHLGNLSPTDYLTQCYSLAGVDPKWPRPIEAGDTSDTYATALRESDDWEEVIPSEDFYSQLRTTTFLPGPTPRMGQRDATGYPVLMEGTRPPGS